MNRNRQSWGGGVRTTSGNDWLWAPTRFAIYARDGFACLACGALELLSIDHVDPHGTNHPTNLVTLCKRCNGSKARRPLGEWCPELVDEVLAACASPIDRALGRELAREYRPSRLAAHAFRNSPAERRRRAAARAAIEDAVISEFEAFVEQEIRAGSFPDVGALRRAS